MIMLAQDLLALLRAFALKTKSPSVDLRQFYASLPKGQVQPAELETAVNELVASESISVAPGSGASRFITLPDFPLVALAEEYRQLTVEPTRAVSARGSPSRPDTRRVSDECRREVHVGRSHRREHSPGKRALYSFSFPKAWIHSSCLWGASVLISSRRPLPR